MEWLIALRNAVALGLTFAPWALIVAGGLFLLAVQAREKLQGG